MPAWPRHRGWGIPAGGIAPVRSFTITFSQVSASAGIFAGSSVSSMSPAVFSRWLWQVTQYWFTSCGSLREQHGPQQRGGAIHRLFGTCSPR